MPEILVNLKRFDVPRSLGGICPSDNPAEWASWVIEESVKLGLGKLDGVSLAYFFPEALLISAIEKLASFSQDARGSIAIGSQGVFRENIAKGKNFGAFTTNLPALASRNLGCTWAIIGHSEERKDKFGLLQSYDPSISKNPESMHQANQAVDEIINAEVLCAYQSNLNVLLCVGETAEERGEGDFETQKPNIKAVLKTQLETGLKSVKPFLSTHNLVIGYEPRWAIGPGKTPPGAKYIGFVSTFIKSACQNLYGFTPSVVYGGGLKDDNASMIASIPTIDGGLVALTKFTGDIAFEPEGLKRIVDKYCATESVLHA